MFKMVFFKKYFLILFSLYFQNFIQSEKFLVISIPLFIVFIQYQHLFVILAIQAFLLHLILNLILSIFLDFQFILKRFVLLSCGQGGHEPKFCYLLNLNFIIIRVICRILHEVLNLFTNKSILQLPLLFYHILLAHELHFLHVFSQLLVCFMETVKCLRLGKSEIF